MFRTAFILVTALLVAASTTWHPGYLPSAALQAQGAPPPAPLTLVTRTGRRALPTTVVNGQELIALDDVAMLFQVVLRDDPLAGGVTLTYRGRTIIASADQPMASVDGRVITLPSPVIRSGRRWLVPLEFLPRALGPIYDQRIELRRPQRLLLLGDVRVPRVTVRFESAGPPTRATVEVRPQAPVTATPDANRVLIRIDADSLDLALPTAGAGLVEQVRAGNQPNTVALTLTAGAGAPRVAQSSADGVTRLTIDVPAASAPVPAPAAPPTTTVAPPSPATPAATDLPLAGPRPVFRTVVLDPGHGGDDVGVRGAGGLEEKALTLDIARRVRTLLETRLGLRVVLTRDDDRPVEIDARAAVANNSKADLFLSLHANGALSSSLSGAEVYHLRLDREGEEVRRQAQADAVALPVLGGGERTLDMIRWDMAQARHLPESTILASFVAEALGRSVMSPRGVQESTLRVLEGADAPAVLVEMLYLSNPAQEKAAATDTFRNALAQSLFEAVARFRTYAEEQRDR